MKKIYIVGGDGFARECYNNLIKLQDYENKIIFGGFMGHGGYGKTVNYKTYQNLYVGEVSEHIFKDDEYVIIGAGYPSLRTKIYSELKQRNIQFFNLITSDSKISESVNFGEANVIISSSFTVNISIGNGNVFNDAINVGHDVEIGDFNFFGPRSQVLGNVKVGNFNQIGANTVFLPKSRIGNNNKIAPLSAIYKGYKDNYYLAGNPALKQSVIK